MLTRWLSFLFPLSNFFNWLRQKVAEHIAIAMQLLSALYFVVQALNAAGLKDEDIQPIYLQPLDARVAFEQGSIDAWAIWHPFYAAARSAKARVLVDGEGLTPFREFYLASRTFANNPDLVKQVLKEVQVGDWAIAHLKEVADLAPQFKLDVQTLELSERRRKRYGATPIQSEALKQQKIANTFSQLKLIPKPIEVAEAAWSNSKQSRFVQE